MGKRGYKTCKKCGTPTGPRAFTCKNCDSPFDINHGVNKRQRGRNGRDTDWKNLEKGDYIRVLSGSGPRWVTKTGETIPMGYHGLFRIKRVQPDGLLCFPAENKQGEFSFIYMGPEKTSKIGSKLIPHKIRKVDPKFIRGKNGQMVTNGT